MDSGEWIHINASRRYETLKAEAKAEAEAQVTLNANLQE